MASAVATPSACLAISVGEMPVPEPVEDGPAPRRARYAAVLYHICTRTGIDAEMAPILARAMISGRDLEQEGNAP